MRGSKLINVKSCLVTWLPFWVPKWVTLSNSENRGSECVNVDTENGESTALLIAADEGHLEICQLLECFFENQ